MLATPRPFIAVIRRQADCEFHVSFPDFPGCVSSGRTIAEARRNAEQALAAQCWRLHHAGRPVPPPSFIHELRLRGERTEGLVVLVAPPAVSGSPG
jgi:predicted RNase H-like HicB family nuclease